MTKELEFNGVIKRCGDWEGSLNQYLQVGDGVDEEMYYYFLEVLPPVTNTATLIQMGEPYSHVDGKPTFSTLKKLSNRWVYAGVCHKGEYSHVG